MIVIAIRNTTHANVPYFPKLVILLYKLPLLSLGTVKITIRYKNAKTVRRIVNKSENPKYSLMYPPGSTL